MAESNPYAPPKADCVSPVPAELVPGAWRQGDWLVMSRGYQLPLRCVATNQPADGYDSQAIDGADPPISLPLSSSYLRFVRLQAIIAAALVGLGLLAMFVVVPGVSLVLLRESNGPLEMIRALSVLGGLLSLIAGLFWGRAVGQLLVLHAATAHYVWIGGVHPEFLASLPPWPYEAK